MSRTGKAALALLALLCAVLGGGGALALRQNLAHTLQTAQEQYTREHLRTQLDLEDALHGADSGAAVALAAADYARAVRAADADAGQGSSLALYAAGGMNYWSNIPLTVRYERQLAAIDAGREGLLYCRAGDTWHLLMASPLHSDVDGLWLVTAYDVSAYFAEQQRQLRQQLCLQAAVLALAAAAWLTVAALQREADRRTRFVAAFTHEMKTPMTSILGYADLLRSGEQPPEVRRRAADHIYHESARLEQLSRALLVLLGLQRGQRPQRVPVAVAPLFAEVARSLGGTAPLLTEAPPGAAVMGDRVLLVALLRNLVLNAQHASAPGQPVRLLCAPCAGGWRLTVQDEGCGIPPGDLPHVTEVFYRVDKSRSRSQDEGGNGLGLSLCAEIAQAHGTRLHIESRLGQGTAVWLDLPAGEVTV